MKILALMRTESFAWAEVTNVEHELGIPIEFVQYYNLHKIPNTKYDLVIVFGVTHEKSEALKTMKEVRAQWTEAKLVAISKWNREEIAEDIERESGAAYVSRNQPAKEIAARIKEILAGKPQTAPSN